MNVTELFTTCRTFRRFLQRPVPADILRQALDNARITSCAGNAQPLRYVAVTDPETVAAIHPLVKWAASLPGDLGKPKAGEFPTAYVAVVKRAGAGPFADVDLGLAVHALISTAWEAGVGNCMLGLIDAPAIKALLPIDEEDTLRLVVALGYPAHESRVVPVTDDLKYRLDEDDNFLVPKRDFDDVVTFV